MTLLVFIRGGGDLASGVAWRLHRAGLRVMMAELPQPLVVRRLVSFAEAVYRGEFEVEGLTALRAESVAQAWDILAQGKIPVLVDPQASALESMRASSGSEMPLVLVDARMTKQRPDASLAAADLVIGLGPGFIAGEHCHAVIETSRGHHLGRVYWQGTTQSDTGVPDPVSGHGRERVLRSPAEGLLYTHAEIGDSLQQGQLIAEVAGMPVQAPFDGVLRGLLHPGLQVRRGMKIGDVDPRNDPRFCSLISDKSLAMGGSVLEAILSVSRLRPYLW
ncbi:MAG: EF2563 family selenium-dependent molybdenum hydroxylase system protein [Anaerolineales bacterium]|nr:EF2563 family selenium-dependent molybdenum hydroxylase system protein [Anaerolineales bacterium]